MKLPTAKQRRRHRRRQYIQDIKCLKRYIRYCHKEGRTKTTTNKNVAARFISRYNDNILISETPARILPPPGGWIVDLIWK